MHHRPPSRRRPRNEKRLQRRLVREEGRSGSPEHTTGRERDRLDREAANRRIYRARLASGGASLKGVPVTDINALIEALIDSEWLDADKSENRAALVIAVGAALDDIAKPYRRHRVVNGQTNS